MSKSFYMMDPEVDFDELASCLGSNAVGARRDVMSRQGALQKPARQALETRDIVAVIQHSTYKSP